MCVLATLKVSLALYGVESREVPCPTPTLRDRRGLQAPRTCKYGRAIGIANVGVRSMDVLGIEDEDPQHDWRK